MKLEYVLYGFGILFCIAGVGVLGPLGDMLRGD